MSEEVGEKGEFCALGVIGNTTASFNSSDIIGTLDILKDNSWKTPKLRTKTIARLNLMGKELKKGDRVAVHIPSNCLYTSSMTYEYCPLQIKYSGNDIKVIDWVYSFDDLSEGEVLQFNVKQALHSYI